MIKIKKYKITYHYRKSYFKQRWESDYLKKKNKGKKTVIVSHWGRTPKEKRLNISDTINSSEEARNYFNWKYNQDGWKTIDKIKLVK